MLHPRRWLAHLAKSASIVGCGLLASVSLVGCRSASEVAGHGYFNADDSYVSVPVPTDSVSQVFETTELDEPVFEAPPVPKAADYEDDANLTGELSNTNVDSPNLPSESIADVDQTESTFSIQEALNPPTTKTPIEGLPAPRQQPDNVEQPATITQTEQSPIETLPADAQQATQPDVAEQKSQDSNSPNLSNEFETDDLVLRPDPTSTSGTSAPELPNDLAVGGSQKIQSSNDAPVLPSLDETSNAPFDGIASPQADSSIEVPETNPASEKLAPTPTLDQQRRDESDAVTKPALPVVSPLFPMPSSDIDDLRPGEIDVSDESTSIESIQTNNSKNNIDRGTTKQSTDHSGVIRLELPRVDPFADPEQEPSRNNEQTASLDQPSLPATKSTIEISDRVFARITPTEDDGKPVGASIADSTQQAFSAIQVSELITTLDLRINRIAVAPRGGLLLTHHDGIALVDANGNISRISESGSPKGIVAQGGRLVVCDAQRREVLRLDGSGKDLEIIAAKSDGYFLRSPHGLVSDGHGGFYFTDPGYARIRNAIGKVHHIDSEGHVSLALRNLAFPEGVAITKGGSHLLVTESQENRILAFRILSPGKLGPKQVFCKLPKRDQNDLDEFATGICVDAGGQIYVAHHGMNQVEVVSRDGEWLKSIELAGVVTDVTIENKDQQQNLIVAARMGNKSQLWRIPIK